MTPRDRAGQATVTAEAEGKTCAIEFEVVAPNGISLQRKDARGFYHDHGHSSEGFVGRVHLLPDDVNFDAVEYKEEVEATATGGCSFMEGQGHQPNTNWLPVSETVIANRGSRGGIDEVRVRMTITGTVPAGKATWAIPWRYRVRSSSQRDIVRDWF